MCLTDWNCFYSEGKVKWGNDYACVPLWLTVIVCKGCGQSVLTQASAIVALFRWNGNEMEPFCHLSKHDLRKAFGGLSEVVIPVCSETERVSNGPGISRSSGQRGLCDCVVRYWLQSLCCAAIESRRLLLPRGVLLEQLKNRRLWNKNSRLPIILHSHGQTAEKIDCSHFRSGLCGTCRWYCGACLQKDEHRFVPVWLGTLAKMYKSGQEAMTKGSSGTVMRRHVTPLDSARWGVTHACKRGIETSGAKLQFVAFMLPFFFCCGVIRSSGSNREVL